VFKDPWSFWVDLDLNLEMTDLAQWQDVPPLAVILLASEMMDSQDALLPIVQLAIGVA
jgi:hypothetical protein